MVVVTLKPTNPPHRSLIMYLQTKKYVITESDLYFIEPDDWSFINSNGEQETVDVAKTLEANKGILEHPFYD